MIFRTWIDEMRTLITVSGRDLSASPARTATQQSGSTFVKADDLAFSKCIV